MAVAGRRIDVVVVNKEDGGIAVAGRWVYASEGKKQGNPTQSKISIYIVQLPRALSRVTDHTLTNFARTVRRVPPTLPTRTKWPSAVSLKKIMRRPIPRLFLQLRATGRL